MIRPQIGQPTTRRPIRRLALVNFGGIGDAILFSPVITELRKYLHDTHLTIVLETRSQAVGELLDVDAVIPITIQGKSRPKLFMELTGLLRRGGYDAVISSGSSPFIPLMLFASGISHRTGFQTGPSSRLFLNTEAPLYRQAYAGDMYFSLAKSFLEDVLDTSYQAPKQVLPQLIPPSESDREWARSLLKATTPAHSSGKRILLHPGVSRISVQKNILKSWAPEYWAQLIEQLSTTHQVYLVGGPDDTESIQAILSSLPESTSNITNLFGQTRNLKQLAALILEADLLLSADSAPMHLAVGYQTPVVSMFGPTDEKKLIPNAPYFQAVSQEGLECRPCLWDTRQMSCENPLCLDVPVEAMLNRIKIVLEQTALAVD